MEEKISLYIPLGVKTETELFTGFGKREVLQAAIGCLAGVGVALIVFAFFGRVSNLMLVIMISAAASIMMTTKDQYNLSVVDQITNLIRFYKSQKEYKYVYHNEWDEF